MTRYAKSRQKACQSCTKAKAKCIPYGKGCRRCDRRSIACSFSQTKQLRSTDDGDKAGTINDDDLLTPKRITPLNVRGRSEHDSSFQVSAKEPDVGPPYDMPYFNEDGTSPAASAKYHTYNAPVSDPSNDDISKSFGKSRDDYLICPINAHEISNRWLNTYAPLPGQTDKQYPTNVTSYIHRMLKSYAAAIVHGKHTVPFLHSSQMLALAANPQLSTCLSLVRMCAKPTPGADIALASVLENEMVKIHQSGCHEGSNIHSTFQAYLIYALVLYFCLNYDSKPFLRQSMVSLQELACASSQLGIMCVAEQQCVRPHWKTWILAETQRRTLYLMYLFDNLLSIHDGLPTFLGTELQGLPAPASKTLWRANTQEEWETSYNIYLADWPNGGLAINDLWPIQDGNNSCGNSTRSARIDRWLEDIDEFGTMLYAVTCCTHGV